MKRLFLLFVLLVLPAIAQDLRPSAYVGQQKKVTVRGGKVMGSTGGVTTIAQQDITPTVNATTYIYIDLSSTPVVATSTSAFPTSNYFPICVVITDINGIITSFTDSRPDAVLGGSSGGISSPNGATIYAWDPKYSLPQPAKWVCDATYTNASPTVTTPATDRPFLSTDSFAVVWGGSAQCGGNAQVTITTLTPATVDTYTTATFVDAHTITLAGNALATCTPTVSQGGCALVWGPNHTTAIQAAFDDAANNCGTLELPAGGLILTTVIQNTTAKCPTTTGGNDVDSNLTVHGQGWNATVLLFKPGFLFPVGMFNVSNTAGIRLHLYEFQMSSFTQAVAGQAGQFGINAFFNSELDHLSLDSFFTSNAVAFTAVFQQGVLDALTRFHDNLMLNAGFTAYGTGNGDVNFYNNWIQGGTKGVSINVGNRIKSWGNRITLNGTNGCLVVTGTTTYDSWDDVCDRGGASLPAIGIGGNAGTVVNFHNLYCNTVSASTGPCLNIAVNNTVNIDGEQNTIIASVGTENAITNAGTLTLRNTALSSSGGVGLSNSGTVTIKDGNTISNGITNTGTIQGLSSQIVCSSTTPVTVNANVTTDQNLMSCSVPAQTLGWVGRTLKVSLAGVYSTPAASTTAIVIKAKLGALTVATWTSTALGGIQATNDQFNVEDGKFTVTTAGASGAFEAHGNLIIDLGIGNTVADSVFADVNTATVGTVDLTVAQTLQITIAFTVASASNTATQRQLIAETIN